MPELQILDQDAKANFVHRLRLLIVGRMALACLILAASWLWSYNYPDDPSNTIPMNLLGMLVIVSAMTAVYLLLLGYNSNIKWQVRAQFLIDVFLITWYVAETGGLISPYITLYIFLITASGFFLRPHSVYAVGFACVGGFTLFSLLWSPAEPSLITSEFALSRTLQQIAFHDAAFLLVAVLAARMAGRRKITLDLRKAEEDFADLNVLHTRILASINSGIVTTDLDGKIYSFNRAAEEISGVRAVDAVGQSVFSIFGDDLRPHFELSTGRTRPDEFTRAHFEVGLRNASNGGPPVVVACSVSSLVGRSGGVTGLIIAFQDVTEFHEMEETLRRSDRLAAVGRLSAGLAHEIRNPLGSMSSALQFLSKRVPPDTEDAVLMSVVLRESERLNRIITDFLTYARPKVQGIENGHERHEVEIVSAINDCLALIRHDPAVSGSHTFSFEAPERPVTIRANETQVKQVFWNLLQNGVHAMKEGGEISVELTDPTPRHIKVVVTDTGCGMSSENMKRIFEPFQTGGGGTGLGLSIVHKIVTDLGGRINVESVVGKGTRITLDLLK